jgi:hypothetical protein
MAESLTDPEAKQLMLNVAADYESPKTDEAALIKG